MRQSDQIQHSRGFTLLEVLVSVTIASGLLLVLMIAFKNSSENASSTQSQLHAAEEARAGMSILTRDLNFAVRLEEMRHEEGSGPIASDELGFYTQVPLEAQAQDPAPVGTLCYVLYYTAATPELPGETSALTRKLYRRLVSSAELTDLLSAGQDPRTDVDPDPLLDEPVIYQCARFRATPREFEEGVTETWVYQPAAPPNPNPDPNLPPPAPPEKPDWLDLEIILAGENLSSSLRTAGEWDGDQRLNGLDEIPLQGDLHRYETRIRLDTSTTTP